MRISKGQRELATQRVGAANLHFKNLNDPLTPIGRGPLNQRLVETILHTAVMEERNRLAGEIHDTLAQEFAGIILHLEAVSGSDEAENPTICGYLARAKELARCGLEDARRILLGLRPKSLDGAELSVALGELAERFSRDCGIDCHFSATGRAHPLSGDIENELYRVAQEALCNVRKHSRAASVSMSLGYNPGGVVLVIKDNGQGFAAGRNQAGAHGFGLPTMCDRANRLGGRMDINSWPGTGTEVRMTVPVSARLQEKGIIHEWNITPEDSNPRSRSR